MAQAVESLLCKREALSSNPSPTKNKVYCILQKARRKDFNVFIKHKENDKHLKILI
jgi:hypothetical protein